MPRASEEVLSEEDLSSYQQTRLGRQIVWWNNQALNTHDQVLQLLKLIFNEVKMKCKHALNSSQQAHV